MSMRRQDFRDGPNRLQRSPGQLRHHWRRLDKLPTILVLEEHWGSSKSSRSIIHNSCVVEYHVRIYKNVFCHPWSSFTVETAWYLIIINVTHIWMFRNYSNYFWRNVAKRGRNMERRWERNIPEPKFELKSFRLSSCVFYGRGRI